MPKLKTHSGTKDRIKISRTGKIQRRHSTGSHFLQKKSAARKRNFAGLESVEGKVRKSIKRNLGV